LKENKNNRKIKVMVICMSKGHNMQEMGKRDITARLVVRVGGIVPSRNGGDEGYGGTSGPVRFFEEEAKHLGTVNCGATSNGEIQLK
jgi:hypothetical protein